VQAWQTRFGRTVVHQVVDALQQRFSTAAPPPGLMVTVGGEDLSGTPLEDNAGALRKVLGFESVSSSQLVSGSAFSFSPPPTATAEAEGEGEGEGEQQGGRHPN